jgi:Cu/Ag efflux protein CusF
MICSSLSIQALDARAQSKMTNTPSALKGQQVVGRVQDVKGDQVTMDDGTLLTVPASQAKPGVLKPGSTIKYTFQQRSGKKVVTSLEITQSPRGTGSR